MKRILVITIIISSITILSSCSKNGFDELEESKNRYMALNDDELLLKNNLSKAAIIIADITSDPIVLQELVATINSQPRIMEDRVKFKNLMEPDLNTKSVTIESLGNFSQKFKDKSKNGYLKSANNLVQFLIDNNIEVYIPYPLDRYPEGTPVVITSNPIDNLYENIGYFIGDTVNAVIANEELLDTYPIIIVNTPMYTDDELTTFQLMQDNMNQKIQNYNNLKSALSDPTDDWNNESKHYAIYLPEILCKNDHVEGLFTPEGSIYAIMGSVNIEIGTKVVLDGTNNSGAFGLGFPKKYEKDAKNGYYQGWFDMGVMLCEDWQPAMLSSHLTFYMDVPNMETTDTKQSTLSYKSSVSLEVPNLGKAILDLAAGLVHTVTSKHITVDHVYASKTHYRDRYKADYPIGSGAYWSDRYPTVNYDYVEGVGNRPAIQISSEFYYLTYCETW